MNLSTCFFMCHPTHPHPPSPSLLTRVPHHSPTSSLPPPSTTRYPFNIRLATVKLQLTSFAIKDPETGQSITLRPDFRRDKDADSSMVTINRRRARQFDHVRLWPPALSCPCTPACSWLTPFLRFPSHTLHRYGLVTPAPLSLASSIRCNPQKEKRPSNGLKPSSSASGSSSPPSRQSSICSVLPAAKGLNNSVGLVGVASERDQRSILSTHVYRPRRDHLTS